MTTYWIKHTQHGKYRPLQRIDDVGLEVMRILGDWKKGMGQGKIVIYMRNGDPPVTKPPGSRLG